MRIGTAFSLDSLYQYSPAAALPASSALPASPSSPAASVQQISAAPGVASGEAGEAANISGGGQSKYQIHTEEEAKEASLSEGEIRSLKRAGQIECQSCASRQYQDGSDEDVSFKTAAHISPGASASRVRAHEQEHVSNAYKKAAKGGGKVLQATVSVETAVCPECGRTYTAGGETTTKISYPRERSKQSRDAYRILGMRYDKIA